MEQFNIRLKKALALRNMSQADLCALTDIPKSAISQYLSGNFKPKQTRTYILANTLNVNPAWLMGFDVSIEPTVEITHPSICENPKSPYSTEQPHILNKYNKLNTLGQQKTDEYIDDLLENPKYTKDDAPEKKVSLADMGTIAARSGKSNKPKTKSAKIIK